MLSGSFAFERLNRAPFIWRVSMALILAVWITAQAQVWLRLDTQPAHFGIAEWTKLLTGISYLSLYAAFAVGDYGILSILYLSNVHRRKRGHITTLERSRALTDSFFLVVHCLLLTVAAIFSAQDPVLFTVSTTILLLINSLFLNLTVESVSTLINQDGTPLSLKRVLERAKASMFSWQRINIAFCTLVFICVVATRFEDKTHLGSVLIGVITLRTIADFVLNRHFYGSVLLGEFAPPKRAV